MEVKKKKKKERNYNTEGTFLKSLHHLQGMPVLFSVSEYTHTKFPAKHFFPLGS